MIHVSPGHERSVSLEVFFKAIQMVPARVRSRFVLHAREAELLAFLGRWEAPHSLEGDRLRVGRGSLRVEYFRKRGRSFAQAGLESALDALDPGRDVLVTLPAAKGDFQVGGKAAGGHTQYLRGRFGRPSLAMAFKGGRTIFLLLTDHIPLREVPEALGAGEVRRKIEASLGQIERLFWAPEEVLLAGINPHAGEGGLIGDEEARAFSRLPPGVEGPLAGDSLSFRIRRRRQVLIYPYHDQGLAAFKAMFGMAGVHVTLGLDFPRLSPDHGTAFELHGTGRADPTGCHRVLVEALRLRAS